MDTIQTRIQHYLGADPLELIEQLRDLGSERARIQATVNVLEMRRKTLLAELRQERRAAEGKCTEAAADDYAHSHPLYVEFLDQLASEYSNLGSLDSDYWAVKSRLDYLLKTLDFVRSETYALGRQQ